MQVDEGLHIIACDGSTSDNSWQTDSVTADISFNVVQARNNPNFRCVPETKLLVLENKDESYNRLLDDGIYGELTWAGDGPTFNYSLVAYKLVPGKNYSLIYYADGWPGNNPGYHFGSAISDGFGGLTMTGNLDLGMNLPNPLDSNSLLPTPGAKIWLIPSDAYDSSTLSVKVWPFANDWLFESNLITYNKT